MLMKRIRMDNVINIFLNGYRTGCGYSVKEYLEIREKVRKKGTKENRAYEQLLQAYGLK